MDGKTILAILVALVLVVNVCFIGYIAMKPAIPVAEPQNVTITTVTYNDSVVNAKLDAQGAQIAALSVDNDYKAKATAQAVADLSTRDIYNFLTDNNISIDKKSDIKDVVVQSTKVDSFDADNQNAVVIRELKVYYEPSDSTSQKKAYIVATTTIVDGDVEDTVIEFQ